LFLLCLGAAPCQQHGDGDQDDQSTPRATRGSYARELGDTRHQAAITQVPANGRMCSPSRAGRRKMTTISLLSPTPSPVVSARRPPHQRGHGWHTGRRNRGKNGTGQPVDAVHAGLLPSRRREICPYNVKSIAPAATEGSRAGRRAGQPAGRRERRGAFQGNLEDVAVSALGGTS